MYMYICSSLLLWEQVLTDGGDLEGREGADFADGVHPVLHLLLRASHQVVCAVPAQGKVRG